MKKVLLSLSAIALFIAATSCNSGSKNTEGKDSTATDTTAATTNETAKPAETASANVPTFSDEAVTKYCQDYAKLMKDYTAAMEAKDATQTAELSKKATELGQRGATLAGKLKPEEAQKFSEFLTAQSKAMTEAATKAAQ